MPGSVLANKLDVHLCQQPTRPRESSNDTVAQPDRKMLGLVEAKQTSTQSALNDRQVLGYSEKSLCKIERSKVKWGGDVVV
jgi:hypothetical protein